MLWLYLHFPHLLLDSQCNNSDIESKGNEKVPKVVINPTDNCVVQLNDVAQHRGISTNMRLGSAALMCKDLAVYPYDIDAETAQLQQLADWLYVVTSDICLFKPDGLLLRVTPMLALYGGLSSYWQALCEHLQTRGVRYNFSFAYSGLAAKLLARQQLNCVSDDKSQLFKRIKKSPLAACDLPQSSIQKLQRSGIKTLGDLIAQPLSALAKRFDIELITYIGRVTGELKYPYSFYHPKQKFTRHVILLFDIEQVALLQRPLAPLLDDLEAYLRCCCEVAYSLTIVLHLRDADNVLLNIDALQGEADSLQWQTLCQLKLADIVLAAPVSEITLTVNRMGAQSDRLRTDLLSQQNVSDPLALVSLLAAKIGQDNIHGLQLCEDYRPERSTVHITGLSNPDIDNVPTTATERPSLLLPSPQPLTSTVSLKHGPERIVSGWWDGQGVCRDYFVAKNAQGQWLWVFRDNQQQWYLHGWFS